MDLIGSIRLFLAAMGPLAAEGNRAEGGREGGKQGRGCCERLCLREISGVYRLQRGGVRWKAERDRNRKKRKEIEFTAEHYPYGTHTRTHTQYRTRPTLQQPSGRAKVNYHSLGTPVW